MSTLFFKTIDLDTHSDLCIRFRRDSFVCSFADGHERFEIDNGEDGQEYIRWLRQHILELPVGYIHVWDQKRIIGQVESRIRDDGSGYVNLFYLMPEARGLGKGRELHDYTINMFAKKNVKIVQLTVSAENKRAILVQDKTFVS